jgi:hypothetical protein
MQYLSPQDLGHPLPADIDWAIRGVGKRTFLKPQPFAGKAANQWSRPAGVASKKSANLESLHQPTFHLITLIISNTGLLRPSGSGRLRYIDNVEDVKGLRADIKCPGILCYSWQRQERPPQRLKEQEMLLDFSSRIGDFRVHETSRNAIGVCR